MIDLKQKEQVGYSDKSLKEGTGTHVKIDKKGNFVPTGKLSWWDFIEIRSTFFVCLRASVVARPLTSLDA